MKRLTAVILLLALLLPAAAMAAEQTVFSGEKKTTRIRLSPFGSLGKSSTASVAEEVASSASAGMHSSMRAMRRRNSFFIRSSFRLQQGNGNVTKGQTNCHIFKRDSWSVPVVTFTQDVVRDSSITVGMTLYR